MGMQHIKDALWAYEEADKAMRAALEAKREADFHLKECLLRDGYTDCLTVNIARVRRMAYLSKE